MASTRAVRMAEAAPADEVTPVPPAADYAAAEEEEEQQQPPDEVEEDDGDVDPHEPLQKKYYRENSPGKRAARSDVWRGTSACRTRSGCTLLALHSCARGASSRATSSRYRTMMTAWFRSPALWPRSTVLLRGPHDPISARPTKVSLKGGGARERPRILGGCRWETHSNAAVSTACFID